MYTLNHLRQWWDMRKSKSMCYATSNLSLDLISVMCSDQGTLNSIHKAWWLIVWLTLERQQNFRSKMRNAVRKRPISWMSYSVKRLKNMILLPLVCLSLNIISLAVSISLLIVFRLLTSKTVQEISQTTKSDMIMHLMTLNSIVRGLLCIEKQLIVLLRALWLVSYFYWFCFISWMMDRLNLVFAKCLNEQTYIEFEKIKTLQLFFIRALLSINDCVIVVKSLSWSLIITLYGHCPTPWIVVDHH